MDFCNWDRRPAVLFSDETDTPREAFAVLLPGAAWSRVDFWDVSNTAGVMSEAAWRARFAPKFGELDVGAVMALHDGSAFAAAAE